MERRFSISADDEYAASADVLHRATHILVAAGAGASADSGLPTYAEMPAAYNDLCRAEIFLERPEYGYGFWAGCVRDYRKAAPHAGLIASYAAATLGRYGPRGPHDAFLKKASMAMSSKRWCSNQGEARALAWRALPRSESAGGIEGHAW